MINIRNFIRIKFLFQQSYQSKNTKINLFNCFYQHTTRKETQNNTKVDLYQKIKTKQLSNISKNQLNDQSIERYYKKYHCDGCNSILQSQDKMKYGYIQKNIIDKSLQNNAKLIEDTYGAKLIDDEADSKTLQIIHNVEKQLDIQIFNNSTKKLNNLDKIEVLLRLQQKIDQYEEEQQKIKRIKKHRKQIYCQRCYYLKYHNRLPQQYDNNKDQNLFNVDMILNKTFKKHQNKNTLYLYLIDALDISGSFKKYVFQRLIENSSNMCLILNKTDVINQKYLNKNLLIQDIRSLIKQFSLQYEQNPTILQKTKIVKIFSISSVNKTGINNLQQFIQKNQYMRIQLVGYPNTGKTTLLNQIAKVGKPTSKIPGTTLYITQHRHKKRLFFDMPGLHSGQNLCNLIQKPNLKALLTWNKFYSPPVFLDKVFFFGGKVQIKDVRIILFGMGGGCSSDNKWFVLNYKQFWKGLPSPSQLKIEKHQIKLTFENGIAQDIQIAGWGFIGFRLSFQNKKTHTRILTLYLPQGILFRLRRSIIKQSQILMYRSVVKKRHLTDRIHRQKQKIAKLQQQN